MRYLILTCLSAFLICTHVSAQKAAKSVYAEIGGPGLASANFDMRFKKVENGLGFRVGIGGFSVNDDYDKFNLITVPVAINYLIGKDNKNYFEIGAGATYVHTSDKGSGLSSNSEFSTSFGHLHFGYRLQPAAGGFTFRAGITPIFNSNGFIPYYASLSFGYKF